MPSSGRTIGLLLLAGAALFGAGHGTAGPKEDTEQAERAYARDDVVTAISLFRRAADAGYAPAQARLGDIFDAAEEDALAVEYFRKAAAQDLAAGEFGLGRMYDKGEGVAKDPAEALRWYMRAAEKDHVLAVQIIAVAYVKGSLGLPANSAEADVWRKRLERLGGSMPDLSRATASAAKR